jgi:hypothetical protein
VEAGALTYIVPLLLGYDSTLAPEADARLVLPFAPGSGPEQVRLGGRQAGEALPGRGPCPLTPAHSLSHPTPPTRSPLLLPRSAPPSAPP